MGRARDLLTQVNVEHLAWSAKPVQARSGVRLTQLSGKPVPGWVEEALDKLCEGSPPAGVFYHFPDEVAPVGMGRGGAGKEREGIGEIQPICLQKTARRGGFGAKIIDRVMPNARVFASSPSRRIPHDRARVALTD